MTRTEFLGGMDVSCYACHAANFLDGAPHWCQACNAPLHPTPAWVRAHGWPTTTIPARERRRLHHRAKIPVKAVRFEGCEARRLAGTLEVLARRNQTRMNDLLLDLLRRGLEVYRMEAEA